MDCNPLREAVDKLDKFIEKSFPDAGSILSTYVIEVRMNGRVILIRHSHSHSSQNAKPDR